MKVMLLRVAKMAPVHQCAVPPALSICVEARFRCLLPTPSLSPQEELEEQPPLQEERLLPPLPLSTLPLSSPVDAVRMILLPLLTNANPAPSVTSSWEDNALSSGG